MLSIEVSGTFLTSSVVYTRILARADERTWSDVRIYGVAQPDCCNGGRRGWAEHAPCTDSTARNTLTSKALLDLLIPEHDGQETCKVGLAGAFTLRPARTTVQRREKISSYCKLSKFCSAYKVTGPLCAVVRVYRATLTT